MKKDINFELLISGLGLKVSSNGNYSCFNKSRHRHGDNNPSLSIFNNDGIIGYNCFGCSISGNAYKLVSEIKGFNEAETNKWMNENVIQGLSNNNQNLVEEVKVEKQLLRFINKSAHKNRYNHAIKSELKLRNVIDLDLKNIENSLGKCFSKEAFSLTGAKINEKNAKYDYGIAFSGQNFIKCTNENTDTTIYFEGQTDFLTALTIGLHNYYKIAVRKNKSEKIIVNTKINYFILDSDDSIENLEQRLVVKLNNTELFCINSLKDNKDFSDYIVSENLWNDIDEVIRFIEENKQEFGSQVQIEQSDEESFKFFPIDFNVLQYSNKIYKKNGQIFDDNVVSLFKTHTNLVYLKNEDGKSFYFYEDKYYKAVDDLIVMKEIRLLIKQENTSANMIDKIIRLLKLRLYQDVSSDSQNINLLNLDNGIYDFKNFELKPHSKDYYFFEKLDYGFYPLATAPNFEKLITENSNGDANYIKRFLEVLSLSLDINDNSVMVAWIYGIGQNGKSKIVKSIASLFPDIQCLNSFCTKFLHQKFYKLEMRGKRIVISGNTDPNLQNLNTFKEITGKDKISGEKKYGRQQNFQFNGMFILASNNIPMITDLSSVIPLSRRMEIFKFPYIPETPDATLEEKLFNERSGILNLLIEARKRLKANNNTLTNSVEVIGEKINFQINSNPIIKFLYIKKIDLQKVDDFDVKEVYKEFKIYACECFNFNERSDFKGDFSLNGFAQALEKVKNMKELHNLTKTS